MRRASFFSPMVCPSCKYFGFEQSISKFTSRYASVDFVSDFCVRTVGELELLDSLLHQLVLLRLLRPAAWVRIGRGGEGVNDLRRIHAVPSHSYATRAALLVSTAVARCAASGGGIS